MPSRFAHNSEDNTTQPSQTRRQFLLGTGALTAALAGCISDNNQENDSSPDNSATSNSSDDGSDDESSTDDSSVETDSFDPASELAYGQWLTADEDQVLFAYSNIEETPEDVAEGILSDPSVDDPLFLYPVVINGIVIGRGQLSLPYAGLAQTINPNTPSDSTVSELTVINNTVIVEGTFATDQLDERLTEPADETFGVAHEQTDTIGEYDQYEPVEVPDGVRNAPVVGVTDETVIVSQDADRLTQTIAAGNGDEPRIFETDESVAKLLELTGSGDRVVGQLELSYEQLGGGENQSIEPNPQFEPRSSEDVVASISFAGDGNSLDSAFAIAATDLDENRQGTIESSFGTAAVDGSRSIEVSNNRITASGTYNAEQLTASHADQSLSQAAAAELVSPDALTFQYEPPRGQAVNGELWVNVTEDTDAAAVRVEADSGGYSEFQPQDRPVGADDSIPVKVDPEGDAVTVLAVNDGGAAGELVTQSVPTDELSEAAASEAVPAEALSFSYDSPDSGNLGGLTVEVIENTEAETLVAQPQAAPSGFTGRVGSLDSEPIGAGTTVETVVEPDGDEVIVYATVDDATGEVARWQDPN